MPTRDWAKIRKLFIANFNPIVTSAFGSDTLSATDTALKDAMMIQTNDSSLIANSRLALYNQKFPSQAVAAVPEWWQVRPEGKRPQLILLCGKKHDNGNVGYLVYPITIPHPIINRRATSPIPDYKKGNIEAILTLKDNSKVIVNTHDNDTANSLIEAIKLLIDPAYLEGSFTKVGLRKGQSLLAITVAAKKARYFSQGLKNTKPDWIDKYT
ncbi:hypothetical protein [uncultured Nostoc sp.]|uniref:hypothetical protein n=1 Tax=uncultured Nostoc sp. TaxID=340711 RepID=UPI0035CC51BD